ncbi:hypothetical protein FRB97_008665 [Tulasnella sp. 331]|nr:hypothetical protein FRB97_008665 [Tulasnella sp. 331]
MATEDAPYSIKYWSGAAIMREEEPYAATLILGTDGTVKERYVSMTCMPKYEHMSMEELRLAHMFYATNPSVRAGNKVVLKAWEKEGIVDLPDGSIPEPSAGSSAPFIFVPAQSTAHPAFGSTSPLASPSPSPVKAPAPGLGFGKYAAAPARFGVPGQTVIAPHPSWSEPPRATNPSPSSTSVPSDISRRSSTVVRPFKDSSRPEGNLLPPAVAAPNNFTNGNQGTPSVPSGFGGFPDRSTSSENNQFPEAMSPSAPAEPSINASRPLPSIPRESDSIESWTPNRNYVRPSVSFEAPPPEAFQIAASSPEPVVDTSRSQTVNITPTTPSTTRFSSIRLMPVDDEPELLAAERTWEESRRVVRLRQEALRRAKEEYDVAIREESECFRAYSEARMM